MIRGRFQFLGNQFESVAMAGLEGEGMTLFISLQFCET